MVKRGCYGRLCVPLEAELVPGTSGCACTSASSTGHNHQHHSCLRNFFYIHDSLPSLTDWSKWPYRAGTIFFHFIGEIIKIQKGSAAIPTSTPISHYTIKAASKVLSEFEMKFSICMLPHVRLPSYKMFTGTMYSPLYPELSMVLTEVTLKNVCWINELGNNPFFLN